MNRYQLLRRGAGARALLVGMLTVGVLVDPAHAQEAAVAPTSVEGTLIAPIETLGEFRPLVTANPDGSNIIELEGDPQNGASITLFRYTNGYTGSRRLHTHSSTYRSVLIEGEMKHWTAEGSEQTAVVLRPGSYWRQRGGELHADHCLTDRCLALVTFEGPIDADFPDGHD